MTPLILASQSPNRKQLLSLLDVPFTIQPAHVDETERPGESPQEYVTRIAHAKATKVAAENPGCNVLAADTPVILGNRILQTPHNRDEAREMVKLHSGRRVDVPTVMVLHQANGTILSEYSNSWVEMRELSDAEIEAYLDHEAEWQGSSGAFKVQGRASVFITATGGTPTGIMGFPLHAVAALLRRAGYKVLGE